VEGAAAYEALADTLITWEMSNGRRYPWRYVREAYPLAVAELLLQKTKGEAAAPVWAEVIIRWPSPSSLASANVEELRDVVAPLGLGNQRTDRLIAMASAIRAGSALVPGLGPYGSGVLALSQGNEPKAAPVDGNIARVVSRLFGLSWERGEPRKKAETRARMGALLAAADEPLEMLYGIVDIGAEVCLSARPRCIACPIAPFCTFAQRPGVSLGHSVDSDR
jgi:A/G-specific adenine glycosylase